MKNYTKILLITLAIQLSGIVLKLLLSKMGSGSETLIMLGNIIVVACVIASVIVDIILAIRLGTNIRKKLIYIFLMPTNYLWILYIIWAFLYIGQWIHMLSNIHK